MCRRQGYMIQDMERKCVTTKKFWETHNKVDQVLKEVVLEIVKNDVNDLIENNLKPWEKRVKRRKESKISKSARGSSSKHLSKESTKYVSKQKSQQHEWDAWEEENVIDEDEVIPDDETSELITEFQDVDKRVPTIFDRTRMEATLRDSLSNLSRNAEEYAYHLKQSTSFMENKIIWENKQQDIPQEFPEPDLEEKLNWWVRKEFKTFNEDARLSIQHWKDSWHKRVYTQNQKKVMNNPEDYYSNNRITEVVRIVTNQSYGLDYMEQILVMRANDKPDSFSEADSKRSRVIWERVHDFHMGIESYQMKKLLKDLKELAEYDQSTSTDRPIFLNDNKDHHVQNKESPKNSSEENIVSKTNQEPPQDSDIHQLIEECSIKVPEEQKQKNGKYDEQEVKNVVEQPAEHGNRSIQSLQNFRVVHKSSISFKNTSQISSIHSIAPIQSTKEPEHLFSMGYEHLSITPETESDEVTEFNSENLLPIPSKYEVTLEDEIECDMPAKDDCSPVFTTFSNPLFKDNNDLDSSDDESLPDEDEEIDIVIETDDVLPPSVENDDDFSNDSLLEEADLFLVSDNSIPPGIKNVADDPEGDIRFLEELLIDDSILSHESYDSNFENNPSIPRPPPEPPDVESFFDLKPDVIAEEISDKLNKDTCFEPGREITVSTKIEDDDYFPFMFVIRFFLPYFIFPEVSPLLLSAESEDTIFDPGLSLGD
nr:hypothetical protein [Tanacetum cinerariifolium]